MIIEICVGISTVAFIVLVVFLAMTLWTTRQTLKKAKQVLGKVDRELLEASEVIQNVNELTSDLKKKSESLNFIFRPLAHLNKKGPKKSSKRPHKGLDKIVDYVGDAIVLFKKFKEE